jgi:aryl-alcohol dehydrogenase-like predicted oxidoreductase
MGFGDGSRERWALDNDDAVTFFRQALDLGITFWDTANIYGFGSSETVVGRAIKKRARRDDITLATKVHQQVHEEPRGSSLSRKAIMEQIDASLTRLGTDYVLLYQIHRFDPRPRSRRRWRHSTMWSRRARPATSARGACGRDSSPRCSTWPS